MATNVFGVAVKGAKVALEDKNAGNKGSEARKYAENIGKDCGSKGTTCLVYNATGRSVSLVDCHDWSGSVAKSPYPTRLENGQWGAFFHACDSGSNSSSSALVYEGLHPLKLVHRWVFAWNNSDDIVNRCWTEIISGDRSEKWDVLKANLNGGKVAHHVNSDGALSYASIGNTSDPIFEAIMVVEDDNLNDLFLTMFGCQESERS